MEKWNPSLLHLSYIILSLLFISESASGMSCFQCNSTSERTCGNSLPQHHSLAPQSCKHIQNVQYCVKMTGLVEGQLGTKRFCSARDWGNYCEWVKRPGDEREYRACVFTCQFNGCNHAPASHAPHTSLIVLTTALLGTTFFL